MSHSPCLSLPPPPPESPTVMLAAGSFSSPYEHLSQPETKRMVEHYTAYLSDNTRLIANPGLKVHAHTRTHLRTHQHTQAHTYIQTDQRHSFKHRVYSIYRHYRHMITYREYTHTRPIWIFLAIPVHSPSCLASASGGKPGRGVVGSRVY